MSKEKQESEWISDASLAAMLDVTTMTLWRGERDEKLGFPQPTIINTRRDWRRDDVNNWMRRMATGKASQAENAA
jgi:predicted DNA-binding transcriptional regulator AlpA